MKKKIIESSLGYLFVFALLFSSTGMFYFCYTSDLTEARLYITELFLLMILVWGIVILSVCNKYSMRKALE